jgi:hypothetical protein
VGIAPCVSGFCFREVVHPLKQIVRRANNGTAAFDQLKEECLL